MRRDTLNILNIIYKNVEFVRMGVSADVNRALVSAKEGQPIDGMRGAVVTNLVGDKDYESLRFLFKVATDTDLGKLLVALGVDPATDFDQYTRGVAADFAVFERLMANPPKKQGFFGKW
ncbi:hypothetical protein [Intrasporangium calvum]|nr:hypothetical protein [Intrasporangium calvum]